MTRFKTLKDLAEYAHYSTSDILAAIDTVTIAIEQEWVYVTPTVRKKLMNNSMLMQQYVLSLLNQYLPPENVVDLFSKKNREVTRERRAHNLEVLRQYRIKP